MDSPAWWERRRIWLVTYRASHNGQNPTCVICDEPWTGRHGDLHHRTYERLGHEAYEDLIPMCRRCHDLLHGIINSSGWSRSRAMATDLAIAQVKQYLHP